MDIQGFWNTLFRSLYQFVNGIGDILRGVFNLVRSSEFLLLYFGFLVLGFSIYIFARLLNRG